MSDHDAGPPALPPEATRREARDVGEPRAWRLTYAYDASGIRLVAQQRIATVAPPDDSDLTERGRAGYWVEVRDESGEALYRQVITNPFRAVAEAHTPVPGRHPTHVPTVAPEGAFQVVVPDLPGAREVVLHGLTAPGEPPEPTAPAEPTAPTEARPRRRRRAPEPAVARPLLTERLSETPPFEVS
jgi:hypothetical protein